MSRRTNAGSTMRRRTCLAAWRAGRPFKALLAAVILAAACTSSGGDAESGGAREPRAPAGGGPSPRCVPLSGELAADATLDGWAGEYTLTMVGGAEGDAAASAQGTLILHQQSADLRQFSGSDGSAIPRVVAPLFGTTDVGVEAVGALRVGDLSSTDPAAPGVLVIESEIAQGPSILLRFGSDANRRDMVRFDGGFTVLEVREIGDDGFSGTWTSGAWTSGARGRTTGGYFCAERVAG